MFFECIKCPKFKRTCRGRNFLLQSGADFIRWVIAYKTEFKLSNAKLSVETKVPVGTLNRILSDPDADIKYETAHMIMQGIVGDIQGMDVCPDQATNDLEPLRARVQHLEQELTDTKTLAHRNDQRDAETIAHLTKQTRNLRLSTIIFAGVLFLVLVAIICVLLYDITHPGIGYIGQMHVQ